MELSTGKVLFRNAMKQATEGTLLMLMEVILAKRVPSDKVIKVHADLGIVICRGEKSRL